MLKSIFKYASRKVANVFFRQNITVSESLASISKETIEAYNKTRDTGNRNLICYAPYKNIYFNIQGDAAPCWLTFKDPDSYPEKSIHDIWFGEKFSELRNNIRQYDLSGKCSVCNHYINNQNFVTPLARAYDNDYPDQSYPVMMELELANTCNLECVMCNDKLSSSIRKNREKLPPRHIPYDEVFVKQLEEFIPHLYEARFNGGEPFLNDIYYRIWENILAIRPSIKVVIATNGTVMNDKVKNLLEKGHFDINLSCDSLQKETYESIRVNGVFEKTMENIVWFQDYCKRKNTTLCILTNPMRQNWHEMPDFIHFCNERNLPIWFNTIHRPYDCALWTLSSPELQNIFDVLSSYKFDTNPLKPQTFHNQKVYKNLVDGQIKTWISEALEREKEEVVLVDTSLQPKIIADDPKRYFYHQLNEALDQLVETGKATPDKGSELISKFEKVSKEISGELSEVTFFEKIIQVPVESIIADLEKDPIDILIQKAKKLYFQEQ